MSTLDIRDIMDMLPHRYPFLLIDRIVELDTEAGRVVALKNVTANEPQFTGHFPGVPVMPRPARSSRSPAFPKARTARTRSSTSQASTRPASSRSCSPAISS